MKRLNFNIKDRKILTLGLCLILVCVFTLTIAYAALNAVLTISGNAQVTSADWDIYLANPKVTNGSATTNVPEIKISSTLEFSTTLNMPGDFYEFTVDVVNGGDIDAMIENVVKNPELDASQKKYLNYEITYQNGESITTKQLLAKNTTMPIKVRIEYRKDLVASDLPSGQVVLDLSLKLEYIQSDGTGTSVPNNGVYKVVSANGDINEIGTIVTIGTEQFYTIGTEGDNVKLLSMYNLYVGYSVYRNGGTWIYTPLNETGLQDSTAIGCGDNVYPTMENPNIGIPYNKDEFEYTCEYKGSKLEIYVNNYKVEIEKMGVVVQEARMISYDELVDPNTFACSWNDYCSNKYPWIYSTSYVLNGCEQMSIFRHFGDYASRDVNFGVRPVIVISKDYF